jgi:hypothetical protein
LGRRNCWQCRSAVPAHRERFEAEGEAGLRYRRPKEGFTGTIQAARALDNVRVFGFSGGSDVNMTSRGAGGNFLAINNSVIDDNGTGVFIDRPAVGRSNPRA